ncbi:hypothetical protein JDS90_32975, partial [Bacillus cereus]|nr:hypothetical protein [Bacillus cereus]MBJ8038488.1 hypothetical protein [Bacillus cereus]
CILVIQPRITAVVYQEFKIILIDLVQNYATIELPVFTIIAITQSNVINVLE